MKSLGNNLCIIIVFMILGSSCSQTKRLTEGEILYTGNSARDKNGVLLRPVPYLDFDNSGYLISYFSPVNIEADKKIGRRKGCDSALLDELSLKVSENSNPVLLFYKWIY